jgi:protein SCO1/2
MKKFVHHHWTRAQKKLATAYGRMAILAALAGVLSAGLFLLWQTSSDENRRIELYHEATQIKPGQNPMVMTVPPNGKTVGGPFELIDQNGKTVHDTDYRGKFLLVNFGYTYCPDMCPTGLQSISHALDTLGADADKVQPLYITIDPARDTPAKLKQYVIGFHPKIIGLTGSESQIETVAKEYQAYYAKGEPVDDHDYLMDHSSLTYLMGPDGKFISLFNEEIDPAELVKILRDSFVAKK